jgi:hypothetical protein
MNRRSFVTSTFAAGASLAFAEETQRPSFHAVSCEGVYPKHLQGFCTNERDAIFWCFTTALVKTDAEGHVIRQVPVASHHGDLCHKDGRVYVAVNFGKFNEPAGKADSWVFVYDSDTLAEIERHPVPELVHGAGGMAYHDGRFVVIGGLHSGANENYVYEYNGAFKFHARHVLASGYTLMGIQTVTYSEGGWWFGCYGKPAVLLRSDEKFRFNGKWDFNASYGIAPLDHGRFLIAQNTAVKAGDGKTKGNQAHLSVARTDEKAGLIFET